MLSITRRVGEKLHIGHDVEIMVTRVRDGSVRLAIKAPEAVAVVRDELLTRKPKEVKAS